VVVVLAAATISAGVRATRSESPARSKATPGTQPVPAPGSTQATTTTRPLPPEPAYVTTIKAQVSELRGLAWKAPLAVDVVSKTELARRYRAGVERDIKPDRLAGDGDAFTVLHLIPAGTDYAKTVEDLFAGLVLGFYDPETKELVVGDSGGELDPGTKVTLAHELDHALTDQWFDFGSRTKALDDADRQEELDAFDALIEGDAKLLEERFADKYLTEDEQLVYALGGLGGGGDDAAATAVARAPKFILDYLYFPYTQGLEFVRAQDAGRGFPGVDDAYRRPPTSTEQILHPDLYAAAQGWTPPDLPDLAPSTGCQVERRNSLGEFKMDEVLAGQLGGPAAEAAAAGWNGDVFVAVRCGAARGLVDRWQADSDAAAGRLSTALSRWARGWSRSSASAGGTFSGPGGSARILRDGARVDLVLAADSATADRLAAAL
jgi:hypothetical protein